MTIKNKKMKGLGIVLATIIAVLLVMVWFDKITLLEAKEFINWVIPFILTLGFFAAKDHDKDNNADLMKGPGGGGVRNPKPKDGD